MADGRDDARSNANQQFVLEQTARGEIADFRTLRNWSVAAKPRLSAAFIRRLMLGLIPDAPIQLPGLRIRGAFVEGELDLVDCSGAGAAGLPALALEYCDLPYKIDVSGARLARLSISHSRFRELVGENVRVDGHVEAIASRSMQSDPAGESSRILLRHARIGGSLDCSGAKLCNPGGDALNANAAQLEGALILRSGDQPFEAVGGVSLVSANIGGPLELQGADLKAAGADALILQGAQVGGGLMFLNNSIDGGVRLSSARVRVLFDDQWAWGTPAARTLIDLRNIEVDRVGGMENVATQTKRRIAWLKRNTADGKRLRAYPFNPQPWRQVSAALERAGEHAAARKLRREEAREANRFRPFFVQPFYWLFGEQMFGYGLSALRAGITLGVLWLAGALGALAMHALGVLVERQERPVEAEIACYSASPALYALDAMIPIIDLGQESACEPGRADGKRYSYRLGPLKIPEIPMWRWAKAIYSILGAAAVSFAILTWSGVFRPRAEP